ncbi:MAG: xanthine dehydrogenase small subunit [Actinomycetes bacterium]
METPAVNVNGQSLSLEGVSPHTTALDWLRDRGLTGCKEGCAEGECGACSILVARPGLQTETEWTALNACLVPVASFDGQELVTAEGLGRSDCLHPVQREMAIRGGSQCGYCTPGFVCSMAAEYYRPGRAGAVQPGVSGSASGTTASPPLVPIRNLEARTNGVPHHAAAQHGQSTPHQAGAEEKSSVSEDERDHEHGPNGFDLHALSGNLCRCTGYRPIRDAAYALDSPDEDDVLAARRDEAPPQPRPTRLSSGEAEFVRPATLADALDLLQRHPDAVLVAGSTDWGVEVNLRGIRAPLVVAVDRLPELRGFDRDDERIEIGAALSLTEIERRLDGSVPLLAELFPQFASRLIRNGATIGGNLGTGSPIGDTPPALLALEATVVLASARGDREVPLSEYFTGYRQSVREPDELIRAVRIPLPLAPVAAFHKIAKRRFDDISSVALGFALDVEDGVVRKARIGVGGVAATPIRARAAEEALEGQPWTEETVGRAAEVLGSQGTPIDDHRASAAYRAATLGQSLHKLYAENPTPQEVGA